MIYSKELLLTGEKQLLFFIRSDNRAASQRVKESLGLYTMADKSHKASNFTYISLEVEVEVIALVDSFSPILQTLISPF